MNDFLKAAAFILVALILCLNISKQNKEISVLLVITAVCILVIWSTGTYIKPLISYLQVLQKECLVDEQMIRVLFRAAAVGFTSEIVNLICSDSGYAALGKTLKTVSVFVILWISIPLIGELMNLIDDILMAI